MKERSSSREGSRTRFSGDSGYKKKIKSVKHRVDCWNSKSILATPAQVLNNETTPIRKCTLFDEPTVAGVSFTTNFGPHTEHLEIGMTEYIQVPVRHNKN